MGVEALERSEAGVADRDDERFPKRGEATGRSSDSPIIEVGVGSAADDLAAGAGAVGRGAVDVKVGSVGAGAIGRDAVDVKMGSVAL